MQKQKLTFAMLGLVRMAAVVIASLSALACGRKITNVADTKLVGGALDTQARYQSTLFLYFLSGYSCTGTKVAPGVILTAGHCVTGQEAGDMYARGLGFSDQPIVDMHQIHPLKLTKAPVVGTDYKACVQSHYECNIMSVADVGVYFVEESGAFAAIPVVPVSFVPTSQNERLVSVGYGCESIAASHAADTGTSYPHQANRRKAGTVQVVEVSHNYIRAWAANNSVQSCAGDSGGPLYRQQGHTLEVVAIVSSGRTASNSNYTRLSAVQSLLKGMVSEVTANEPPPALPPAVKVPDSVENDNDDRPSDDPSGSVMTAVATTAFKYTKDQVQGVEKYAGQWCVVPVGTQLHVEILAQEGNHTHVKLLAMNSDLPNCAFNDTTGYLFSSHFRAQ